MIPPSASFSAAADRNQAAIFEVLQRVLPATGEALEIASGTGQHAAFFASRLPGWNWQPSDMQTDGFGSIEAWAAQHGATNLRPPLLLDVTTSPWLAGTSAEGRRFDAIFCANMLHISPWATCAGLMQGAATHLRPDGALITYGPYLETNVPTAPGNLAFDASLRAQNPAWGVRQREEVEAEAARVSLALAERHAMPANNLLLVWRRQV